MYPITAITDYSTKNAGKLPAFLLFSGALCEAVRYHFAVFAKTFPAAGVSTPCTVLLSISASVPINSEIIGISSKNASSSS